MHSRLVARWGIAAAGLAALAGALLPAAASADWVYAGARCVGVEVDRCGYVQVNTSTDQIRAVGNIGDDPGYASNYTVAAHDTQLQTYKDGGWVFVSGSLGADYDGWWPVWDMATGPALTPVCGNRRYRSLTHFQWKGASPGDQWVASNAITSPRQC